MVSKEKKAAKEGKPISKEDSSLEFEAKHRNTANIVKRNSLNSLSSHTDSEPMTVTTVAKSSKTNGINKFFGIKNKKELSKTTENLVEVKSVSSDERKAANELSIVGKKAEDENITETSILIYNIKIILDGF
jgi:hypothetical protein